MSGKRYLFNYRRLHNVKNNIINKYVSFRGSITQMAILCVENILAILLINNTNDQSIYGLQKVYYK